MSKKMKVIHFPNGASFEVQQKTFNKVVDDLMRAEKFPDEKMAENVANARFIHSYREMIRVLSIKHPDTLDRIRDLITKGIREGYHLQSTMNSLMNLVGGVGDCEDVSVVSMFISRVVSEKDFVEATNLEQAFEDNRIIGECLLRPLLMTEL